MLRANHAVRLGLRAASRNPELSFAKAMIDQGGNLLALVPVALAALLVATLLQDDAVTSLLLALRAIIALRWPVLGGIAAALAIAFTASMLLWAGALPLLAADAELDATPASSEHTVQFYEDEAFLRETVARYLGAGLLANG